jgi:hypothetical protein
MRSGHPSFSGREWFGEIVRSSKLLAERINDLVMRFGASASHVYELGSVERISGYGAERPSDTDSPQITLDNF